MQAPALRQWPLVWVGISAMALSLVLGVYFTVLGNSYRTCAVQRLNDHVDAMIRSGGDLRKLREAVNASMRQSMQDLVAAARFLNAAALCNWTFLAGLGCMAIGIWLRVERKRKVVLIAAD